MRFRRGDKVKIVRSGRNIRDCAGGWNDDMDDYVNDGKVYTIEDVDFAHSGYDLEEIWFLWDERLLEAYEEDPLSPGDLPGLFKL